MRTRVALLFFGQRVQKSQSFGQLAARDEGEKTADECFLEGYRLEIARFISIGSLQRTCKMQRDVGEVVKL